nr:MULTISPECIES: ornithine cyclodeaminase family protein [unclassified Sphingomonas]
MPPRTVAEVDGVWLRTLPAIPAGSRYFGAKLMGMARTSSTPGTDYVIVLFDRETSRLKAFVDGNLVTGFRTAATSAAALDRLAPAGPASLAILGSGLEASMHLRAFASVRPISGVTVFSPTDHKREAFAASMSQELALPVRPATSPESAVRGADIVLTAARSRGEQPILFGDWLKAGATVVSIGSTVPEQREIDASVVDRSDLIVCDTPEEVLHETGDMIAAANAGIDVAAKVHSMGALMTGDLADRLEVASIRMFKSVGAGLQDVVVAGMILERALATDAATRLPIEFNKKTPQKR